MHKIWLFFRIARFTHARWADARGRTVVRKFRLDRATIHSWCGRSPLGLTVHPDGEITNGLGSYLKLYD